MDTPTFAELFKKHRLRSGFSTLCEFGKALSGEGYVYEDSIFSKWKNGDRVPTDRGLVKAMIRIFTRSKSITHITQVNEFMASVDMRDYSSDEQREFFSILYSDRRDTDILRFN